MGYIVRAAGGTRRLMGCKKLRAAGGRVDSDGISAVGRQLYAPSDGYTGPFVSEKVESGMASPCAAESKASVCAAGMHKACKVVS
ncbi:hypothetical protein AVEN_176569-1 [Araneus ventricosus]|uniref:Uncharacterized protein n=1 Tax=Araneus ventricosus TaxID=182803 RepID=A0A4Y2TCK3_ARAVE|nr:hypothetical protein AVEN_176569-1 [Araneus ventricosus]